SGQESTLNIRYTPVPPRFLLATRAGFATNFAAVSTLAIAADASVRVTLGGHALALGLEAGYLSNSDSRMSEALSENVAIDLDVGALLARGVYLFDRLPLNPYVGAGA